MRKAVLLALGAVAFGAAGAATAQDGLRDASRLARQTRAIEARRVTQPDAAARDARNAVRDVVRSSGPLGPDALRAGRRLDDLGRPPGQDGQPSPQPDLPAGSLPRSFAPSATVPAAGPFEIVDLLIDRAGDAASDGRADQARSDLAFAERQLDGLAAGASGDVIQRRRRISTLRDGLDGETPP